jgi:ERAP1-like C-terminal domain
VTVLRFESVFRVVKTPIALPINYQTSLMSAPSDIEWLPSGGFDEIIVHPDDNETIDWFIFNVDQFGFYRVNYDSNNWLSIVDAWRSSPHVFSTKTRAQLIDDALSLAEDGFLSYAIALELLMELQSETSYLPWSAAMRNLLVLDSRLVASEIHDDFRVSASLACFLHLLKLFFFSPLHSIYVRAETDARAGRELHQQIGIR